MSDSTTGELRDCEVVIYQNKHVIVWGHCYNDHLERFEDGRWIHTPFIRSAKDGVVYTRKCQYKVDDVVVQTVNQALEEIRS